MFRRLMVLASTALITGALAGCGNTDSWVEAHAADGWPAQYGDAANSSYTDVAGADALELEWTRSVKGDVGAAVALGSGQYLAVNAQTPAGCSLMVWEADNNAPPTLVHPAVAGRRISSPLWDGFDNLYVGQPGAHDVVPADAVDPMAAAGDRNANHPKDSRAGSASRGDSSGSGSAVRRPSRHRDRHPAGSGGRRRPDGLPARAGRLPAGTAALPGRRRARIRRARRAWWWCRCGSPALPPRCSSA